MERKLKNGEGIAQLRRDGLPKTKNVLAKAKGGCVDKLKTLKDTIASVSPSRVWADMSFGECLNYWYEAYRKPRTQSGTHRTYEGYLRLYIKPRLSDTLLNKLTENDKQQIYEWMKPDEHVNGKGIADSQIQRCRSLCRQTLEEAVEEHLTFCNSATGCKCPPAGWEEMKTPLGETMQRVLIQAKEENYYEPFFLKFVTGLRLRELAALQWDGPSLTTGELRIDKQASTGGSKIVICEPRTEATIHTIILPSSVRRVLTEYKTKMDSRQMFPSLRKEGLPTRPSPPYKRLYRILDYAGCERVKFRGPCYTSATSAQAHGMDIETLSTILCYVSSATILNAYSHITDEMQQLMVEKTDYDAAKAEVKRLEEWRKYSVTNFQTRR